MAGLQRFITYIYKYEDDEKKENAGFAKIEVRGGVCRVEVHIRNISMEQSEATVYLFARNADIMQGISVGGMKISKGSGDVRFVFDVKDLLSYGKSIKDMEGLFVPFEEAAYLASQWKEGKIERKLFQVIEKKEQEAQDVPEAKAQQPDGRQADEAFNQESEVRPDAGARQEGAMRQNMQTRQIGAMHPGGQMRQAKLKRAGGPVRQRAAQPADAFAGQGAAHPAQMPAGQKRMPVSQMNTPALQPENAPGSQEGAQPTRSPGSQEGVQAVNAPGGGEGAQPTRSPGSQKGVQPVNAPGSQEGVQPVSSPGSQEGVQAVNAPGSQKDAQPTRSPGSQEGSQPASASERDAEDGSMASSPGALEESAAGEAKEAAACPKEETNIQATELPLEAFFEEKGWEGIFRKLKKKLKIVYPFEGEEIECVRMQLNDLREFPKKYWYIGNNSFLLHGFFNYRHIIFGEMEEDGRKAYLIGVPGVFQNQERIMAAMFGFPEFRTAKNTEYKTGNFGYWYRVI